MPKTDFRNDLWAGLDDYFSIPLVNRTHCGVLSFTRNFILGKMPSLQNAAVISNVKHHNPPSLLTRTNKGGPMRTTRLFFIVIALCATALAHAGTQVLGFEIGVTTVEQLTQDLSKKTELESSGTNKYSGGDMFKTDGAAYDIEDLTSVLYIFDDQKKLAGVIMDMGKHRFDAVFQFLSKKYKVSAQQRPFVGNQFARFRPADATIEMDAPHLGFTMEVRYIRNDLMQKVNVQSAAEAAAKKRSEASKF